MQMLFVPHQHIYRVVLYFPNFKLLITLLCARQKDVARVTTLEKTAFVRAAFWL